MTIPRRPARRIRFGLALVVLGAAIGLPTGVLGFTFFYANGASYLADDPAACANCHVMREQYDGWRKSSHHAVATCNDCHTPHSLVPKYLVKVENGWHHSRAFTTGDFHEPIRIRAKNLAVTEASCRHCHGDLVEAIDRGGGMGAHSGVEPVSCVRCHESVGHLH